MKFVKTEDGMNEYYLVCEGCKSEGVLTVPVEALQISCPEKCGASYVQWNNPLTGKPDLQCVVSPVFIKEKEDDDPGICSLGYDMRI